MTSVLSSSLAPSSNSARAGVMSASLSSSAESSVQASVMSSSYAALHSAASSRGAPGSGASSIVAPSSAVPVWRSVGEKSALRGYLTVLGVTTEASLADIRGAYKKLALQWHPDRSDAPNARMKFQELSQAYMALCVEDVGTESGELDSALYERAAQQQCEEVGYLTGMAGVTSGLAGVFCGSLGGANAGAFSSFLGLGGKHADHLDLYRGAAGKKGAHALTCTCHAHQPQQQPQVPHAANCQCHAHADPHKEAAHSAADSHSHHDVAAAAAADVSLLTGVLPPPQLTASDSSCLVRIQPLAHSASAHLVYQIEMKIKKSYQLVYQGSDLSYTVPNLVSGCKYMFRVRACPAHSVRMSGTDSDEEEVLTDGDDAGLGVFSQPASVNTLGTKPDGNAPHPPVLSNLQLSAQRRKEAKGASKKSNKATPSKSAKEGKEPSTPPHNDDDEPQQASGLTTPHKLQPAAAVDASPAVSAPPTPSAVPTPAPASAAPLSKKDKAKQAKAEEAERKKIEAAAAAELKLAEEVAYQKFLMAMREKAETERLAEEKQELDKYAALKRQKELEAKAALAAEKAAGGKRGKKGAQQAATAAAAASAATPTAGGTPPAQTRGKGGKAAAAAAVAADVAAAQATASTPGSVPIMHIKLTPEQQAAIKQQQPTKDVPAPVAEKPAGRNGRMSKAQIAAAAALTASNAASAVTAAPVVAPVTVSKPAWGVPLAAAPLVSNVAVKSVPVVVAQSNSPIIVRAKQLGGKAWASSPAQPQQPEPATVPTSATLPSHYTAADSLLTEHLHRFDSSKPWQADLLAQQQALAQQQQLQLQQQQRDHHAALFQSDNAPSRYPHIAAYNASHSLSGLPPSTATPSFVSASNSLSSASLPSSAWTTEDDDLTLSDLQQELDLARWSNINMGGSGLMSSPTPSAAEAAWNRTENVTLPSHSLNPSSLHFAPLSSSILSDYGDSSAQSVSPFAAPRASSGLSSASLSTHDGIFSNSSRSGSGGFFTAGQPSGPSELYSDALPSSTYSSATQFDSQFDDTRYPSTGLSRDAPTFNPSTSLSQAKGESALLPLHSSTSAMGGHTRRPLPAAHASGSASAPSATAPAPALSGIFSSSSFALPSFSSFSSSFGAQPQANGHGSSLLAHSDWSPAAAPSLSAASSTSSSSLRLHDDLYETVPALQTDADDVLIPAGRTGTWRM